MIEVAKLNYMLALEVAATKWFTSLSPKEQHAYLSAHPASKMGGMHRADHVSGGRQNEMAGAMETLKNKHYKKALSHWEKSRRHREYGKSDDKWKKHAAAARAHEAASDAYGKSMTHFHKGELEKGRSAGKYAAMKSAAAHNASSHATGTVPKDRWPD